MNDHGKPPDGLKAAGQRLWSAVAADYDLEQHELVLLVEACRTADVLDELVAVVERDGLLAASSQGERAHPALTEARQQRIVLARLLAALRLPAGEEDTGGDRRPSRRPGVRGVYGPRGAA